MQGSQFAPGDWVVYTDPDNIQWGPWEITHILCDQVTVLVDGLLEHPVSCDVIQKVDRGRKGIKFGKD